MTFTGAAAVYKSDHLRFKVWDKARLRGEQGTARGPRLELLMVLGAVWGEV